CVSDFGMAHSDFWSEGRILIAGDSRVRRLTDNPDTALDKKIDYAFQPGILVDDLVDLVDGNLNEHHSIIILIGMIGDEIQKYVHHVSDGSSVNLFRSKECDATEKILISVKAASDGKIDTVNEASKSWMRKLMCYMNSPAPDATLVQKEMADLLPVEEDKREEDKTPSSESEMD
ncbi:unnamed protein product, partial [Rotaria socialis]